MTQADARAASRVATEAPGADEVAVVAWPLLLKRKVTERVEQGTGRVVSPAKLTAILNLKNSSANQTVRLVAGKILYIDATGQPIKLEDMRTAPTLTF